MKTLQNQYIYDIFLIIITLIKIVFILLRFKLTYFTVADIKTKKELQGVYKQVKHADFILLLLIFILLIYIFLPTRHIDTIKITKHERIILFSAGIMGLIQLDWSIPKQFINNIFSS